MKLGFELPSKVAQIPPSSAANPAVQSSDHSIIQDSRSNKEVSNRRHNENHENV